MHCMFLLYLFMELGAQQTGKAGENVNKMNSLMDHFHKAMQDFYESDNPAMENSPQGKALWEDFQAQLTDIKNAVEKKPSWFQDTAQGKQIADSITSAISGISGTAESATTPGSNPLYNLWNKYDPSSGSGASSGSTGDMNPFMQQLGQLNQQLTSTSQIVSAEAKTIAKTWQSEMDSYNNFSKAINNLVKFMTQQQQSR